MAEQVKPDIKEVWYTDRSETSDGSGAGVYKWDSKKGQSFSLGLHTTVFQTEILPSRHAQWRIWQKATKVETYILTGSLSSH